MKILHSNNIEFGLGELEQSEQVVPVLLLLYADGHDLGELGFHSYIRSLKQRRKKYTLAIIFEVHIPSVRSRSFTEGKNRVSGDQAWTSARQPHIPLPVGG